MPQHHKDGHRKKMASKARRSKENITYETNNFEDALPLITGLEATIVVRLGKKGSALWDAPVMFIPKSRPDEPDITFGP